MKILVMGSGAVGGYFGAVLSRNGHDVTFIARGTQLDAIRKSGMRIESANSGNFIVKPPTTDRPDVNWDGDLVLYCVKGYDNITAIKMLEPAVGPNTSILTLQNGIGSGDVLAAAFGQQNILLGVTYIDAVRTQPGVVKEMGDRPNIIFGNRSGAITSKTESVHNVLQNSGIDVLLSSNIERDLWEKLIHICAFSGMICITRSNMREIIETPEARELTHRIMLEAESVANAKGIRLSKDYVANKMIYFDENKGGTISSMFTDLSQGNRIEIDVLNGAVAKIGKEIGVETPVNEFISTCLMVSHKRALANQN